jgi:hypothetical protein
VRKLRAYCDVADPAYSHTANAVIECRYNETAPHLELDRIGLISGGLVSLATRKKAIVVNEHNGPELCRIPVA